MYIFKITLQSGLSVSDEPMVLKCDENIAPETLDEILYNAKKIVYRDKGYFDYACFYELLKKDGLEKLVFSIDTYFEIKA